MGPHGLISRAVQILRFLNCNHQILKTQMHMCLSSLAVSVLLHSTEAPTETQVKLVGGRRSIICSGVYALARLDSSRPSDASGLTPHRLGGSRRRAGPLFLSSEPSPLCPSETETRNQRRAKPTKAPSLDRKTRRSLEPESVDFTLAVRWSGRRRWSPWRWRSRSSSTRCCWCSW